MSAQVSVIIPSYNRRNPLVRLLDSLAVQTLPAAEFEAFVVLDGSTDDSAAAVHGRDWPFALQVIEQANAGAGAARNAGAALAGGEFLLFVDDDIVLAPGSLESHLQAARRCERSAFVGHLNTVWQTRNLEPLSHSLWSQLGRLEDLQRIPLTWCYSGNLLVPRSVFHEAGGFNASLRRMEDLELGFRLDKAGVAIRYCRGAVGTQHYAKSTEEILADAVTTGRTTILLFRSEPEFLRRDANTGRRHNWLIRHLAELATIVPVPKRAATLASALPLWLPGCQTVRKALWFRWYLVGARRAAESRAEFHALLART